VWDASIVGDLADCGIEYAIVDDYHFLCAGVDKQNLNGWRITENGGKTIGLFPISQALRYQAPFWDHKVVAENIAKIDGAAILFDDGEKFGSWPGTHEWVYEKGWLKNFAKSVLENDAIETAHYEDYKSANAPLGIVYPPDVSYAEMGEWSLKATDTIRLEAIKDRLPEEDRRFVRGASWKNFLVKYEESGRIHRRALALSKKNPRNDAAFQDALLKAQCNDCLWHGVFGGLYLPSLRDTAWRYLIAAENALKPKNGFYYEDWNLDGRLETRVVTDSFVADFEPKGGALTGLYLRSARFNLLNVLTRRAEAYHGKIKKKEAKSENGEGVKTIHDAALSAHEDDLKHLIVDRYVRAAFIDHIDVGEFDLDSFFSQSFEESDTLANRVYQTEAKPTAATLSCDRLVKTIGAERNALAVTVTIGEQSRYVQEHNFHFADLAKVKINGREAIEAQTFEPIAKLELFDPYLNATISLAANRKFKAFSHALFTVSQSESGVDLTCQGVAIALDFGATEADCAIAVKLEIEEKL
jgi:hypothetical protein